MANDNNSANNTSEEKNAITKRKFEIAVYDEDLLDDGSIRLKQIPMTEPLIIEAATKAEFNEIIKTYKECGQQIKIIREITPPPRLNTQKEVASLPCNRPDDSKKQQVAEKRKPSIFKIGDIEIKEDNGSIYQKQWIKLTDKEAANFRIINSENNKIVNLNGKHIEMKRWVKVNTVEDDLPNEGGLE